MKNFFTKSQLLMLVACCALISATIATTGQSRYKTLVSVDKVRLEPLSQTIPVIGALVAKRAGNVAAEVGGSVIEVRVETGDRIKTGQLIAILGSDTRKAQREVLRADLRQAKALLQVAQADLAAARQNLDRLARLKRTGAFNRSLFEKTTQTHNKMLAQIVRANAAVSIKEASISVAELEISKSKILSPYAGVVVERKTEVGSYLRPGDAVVKLIADRQLEIVANVPAMRLGGLIVGNKIQAKLEDGTQFVASVRATLPVENPRTRTRPVRFSPKWPDGIASLADAQTVTLFLPIGQARQVVTVHKDAIVAKRGGSVVFVIKAGKAVSRKVKLGVSTGGRIEVVSGLKVGEMTVVRGNERLRPGANVRVSKGS